MNIVPNREGFIAEKRGVKYFVRFNAPYSPKASPNRSTRRRGVVVLDHAPADPAAPDAARVFYRYDDDSATQRRVMLVQALIIGYTVDKERLSEKTGPKPNKLIASLDARIRRIEVELGLVADDKTVD